MKYSSIPLAQTVVLMCKSAGINKIIISPGSRNAPLIKGFTADPFFECLSIVDERSAAFFALGMSQQSGVPAALVCTSGSALLNYYPAIAEAYYSRIPLVVLSADRPLYKIDIGDGQTIRQAGVFANHIGFQESLLQDLTHATAKIQWENSSPPSNPAELEKQQQQLQRNNEKSIQKALHTAFAERLPVHLNLPFEEPLYDSTAKPSVSPEYQPVRKEASQIQQLEELARAWNKASRKMILIGESRPGLLSGSQLQALAADPSVLVFTETTSNLQHPDFFPSIDSIMGPLELRHDKEEQFKKLQPELLLTMGGMIVSKKIKQFLRQYAPSEHWHLSPLGAPDTFYCLKKKLAYSPTRFMEAFLPETKAVASDYQSYWEGFRSDYREKRKQYLGKIPFTDMKAFELISRGIPANWQIQLANSSTVRYAQLFDSDPSNPVYCNRGTSGIEGSTSTAVGAALKNEFPTVLISGDLSFRYDVNGLWNQYLRDDFRILVLNNEGGGIFRILPGKEDSEEFETFFETVQHSPLQPLCEMYGLHYEMADSTESLEKALKSFFKPKGRPALLEIRTPRKLNDKVLLGYFDYLS
ncbi:2-succinyl-5-enolpyruvyl-6-hydroxy-3-cyclohexene-1-carboxylic-acid synthase [Robiginitalea sp. IMCC43444]|uniref:2-succinyl-5-enolpyruvyl-6-hydroxy-3- cyclohexene-1-carboxylic-acid synthase n=1 Tax=Robiginitalea sp. IMCC43444 TaxID=3459121 RepID=UPI00404268F3